MKYLLLIFLSLPVQAKYWASIHNMCDFYYPKRVCTSSNPPCVQVTRPWPCQYLKAEPIYIDDRSKPIYEAESRIDYCSSFPESWTRGEETSMIDPNDDTWEYHEATTTEQGCHAILANKDCPEGYLDPIMRDDPYRVYCTKIVGYEQKQDGYKIVEDPVKKAAYLAAKKTERETKEAEQKEIRDLKAIMADETKPLKMKHIRKVLKRVLKKMRD